MKVPLLILPIIAVVFISGCTTNGDPMTFGDGVVIQAWESDFPRLYSGESIQFRLKVQNQGGTFAEDVETSIIDIDPREWNLKNSKDSINQLIAPDSDTDTPGQTWTTIWTGEAPDFDKGSVVPRDVTVRVSYDYMQTATKSITLVDETELRRIIQQGGSIPISSDTSTSGPLSISVTTAPFARTAKTTDPIPINIKITNKLYGNSGLPTVIPRTSSPRSPTGMQEPVYLEIEVPNGIRVKDCSTRDWYWMFEGKEADVTCRLEITDMPSSGERVNKIMRFHASYRYKLDATTTVTVVGQGYR